MYIKNTCKNVLNVINHGNIFIDSNSITLCKCACYISVFRERNINGSVV